MSELLKWSPFESAGWTSASGPPGKASSQFLDSVEQLFDPTDEPLPVRVEEYVDGRTLVVRTQMPGLDPDRDIEVSVAEGMLRICAEQRETDDTDGRLVRSELRYESFIRNVPLPEGVEDKDITASYKDGVLEVRTRLPEIVRPAAKEKRVPVIHD